VRCSVKYIDKIKYKTLVLTDLNSMAPFPLRDAQWKWRHRIYVKAEVGIAYSKGLEVIACLAISDWGSTQFVDGGEVDDMAGTVLGAIAHPVQAFYPFAEVETSQG
jgi:hypothetical protein